MLSILIPVYNYNVVSLVEHLHRQAMELQISFEILVHDDGSDATFNTINQNISHLSDCQLIETPFNRGRAELRQQLANLAQYDLLLFLDADVMPRSVTFLQNYLNSITENQDAVYGGFAYQNTIPAPDASLRWRYGTAKEQVDARIRNQKPYKIVISGNFLIKKSVFLTLNAQMTGFQYGYDNYFGALLKAGDFKVSHINNEVYHLGLDSNSDYLKKVEASVETLLELYQTEAIIKSDNTLLKTFKGLKKFKSHRFLAFVFKYRKTQLTAHLLSVDPSINKLQFYKLGYMCALDQN
ncbi:glycosyltransferase [Gelidibacter salicanalis]|uniref:Glycosyltransferase n=1 Tax=Gelidibacter salicanalis TaxID=291193 RepID=A0A5C7AQB4_9FLAO|nr:glycosyltransferase [Gelidibacter salicanalis]TXE10521.1 glycosyltransferase [Gelidibacter salicanalis]